MAPTYSGVARGMGMFVNLLAVVALSSWSIAGAQEGAKPTNVILFVGDGMGPAYVHAAAITKHGQTLPDGKAPKLFMETMPVYGAVTTFSSNSLVTDSAASATSLSCGIKTNNGALGVDASGSSVQTIAELAHEKGMSTALVTSVSLNHATPAAFYAHQSSRGSYRDVIDDYFTGAGPDILFGGGIHDNAEVAAYTVQKAQELGVIYLTEATREAFDPRAAAGVKVLGNFGNNTNFQLDFMNAADRAGEPELSDITMDALEILKEKGKPFFLMVEGGAIDWAGHGNNGPAAMGEVLEFDDTIQKTIDFLEDNGQLENTLIIITADHETGGLAINGPYRATAPTGSEIQFGWTGTNHTGLSVPLYAMGPGAEKLAGKIDQTYIHEVMIQALEQ